MIQFIPLRASSEGVHVRELHRFFSGGCPVVDAGRLWQAVANVPQDHSPATLIFSVSSLVERLELFSIYYSRVDVHGQ